MCSLDGTSPTKTVYDLVVQHDGEVMTQGRTKAKHGPLLQRLLRLIAALAIICASPGQPAVAQSKQDADGKAKRVMVLYSFGRDFKPWSDYARSIRTELERQSPWPIEIADHSLVTARSGDEGAEKAFVNYLRALSSRVPPDVVVSIGAPAAAFVQAHRGDLFADIPMVFTAVDERRIDYSKLTKIDTAVPVRINYRGAFENILRVLPDTKEILVVVGTSPIEKFWKDAIAKQVAAVTGGVTLSWTDRMTFEELLQRASKLPRYTAIFWELMIVDAAGVVFEGNSALARLYAVANAPIFSYDESFFGRETVGGPFLRVADTSRQTAAVAVRILQGENAGDIRVPPVEFGPPMFDWRAMQRWEISENRLPPGSEIHFRQPTIWEKYRQQLLWVSAVIVLQSGLIIWLIYERRYRRLAEADSRNRLNEIAHFNRTATVGELSASIAHEIKQPLAAIAFHSGAALRWLARSTPDLNEAQTALKKISQSAGNAGAIIDNLGTMFRKRERAHVFVDVNRLIADVLRLTDHEFRRNNISVNVSFSDAPFAMVLGDPIQLQQVILNIIVNAVEAMSSSSARPRTLKIATSITREKSVLITLTDFGPGIEPENIEKIFDAFYTTKPHGMGMGLSICRSIIEAHGGRIWASSDGASAGMTFCISLPVAA